jgi:thioredoxin-dependent peroxiredoxin
MKIGNKIPDLTILNQNGEEVRLHNISENMILYFYPKDDTPGCTTEGKEFSVLNQDFINLDVKIFGVSKNNTDSHKKFCDKYNFPFDLLADTDGKLCEFFDVWKEKSMFGKKYMGILRHSFFIDKNKIITKIWTIVKPKTHAKEILDYVKSL